MKRFLFLNLFLTLCTVSLFSQNDYTLQFKLGNIETKRNIETIDLDPDNYKTAFQDGYYFLLIQFDKIPDQDEVKELASKDVHLLSYVPNNAYIAKVGENAFSNIDTWNKGIRHISIYEPLFKISPSVYNSDSELYIQVLFHEGIPNNDAKELLTGHYQKWDRNNIDGRIFKLQINKDDLSDIADIPKVAYISLTSKDFQLHIEECKETAKVGQATHASGLNLTGNGVAMSVGDGGTINEHLDLNDRIQNENLIDISNHGSRCSGIIAGEGIGDPKAKGIATSTNLYADYFSNVIFNDDAYYNVFGVVISNNSYSTGTVTSLCAEAGEYTAESVDVDASLRTLNEVIHVFASGNDGGATCAPYPAGYATVRNAWNSAKNTLTVGATDYLDAIANYSSRGPVMDGRLKPEIVAVGSNVRATNSSNGYNNGSGTSFATPTVSGVLSLLYEQYKSLNGGANPNGDLMKAVVVNSARDLGTVGPDYIYGFGGLDAYRATEIIANGNYTSGSVANTASNTHNIVVPAGANKLKVMLYWHDVEATASASPALINNLDLTVDDPSSTNILPLVLDPSSANCVNPATNGVDNLNNIEQVVIDAPAAGSYTVNVTGTSVPMGSQDYVIVYDIIEDHVKLSSPIGGEFYNTAESVNITWNASGYDANTFTLEYSLDNGATWTVISSTIPGTDRNFEWTTPATFTDQGLVRITWNASGLPSDESLSNFTIMDSPGSLTLNPDCSDAVVISWGAVAGATSYDLIEYVSGSWSLVTNTTMTTHTVTGLIQGQTYYYSVRAVAGFTGPHRPAKAVTVVGSSASSINTYPYLEDFESDDGDWFTYGKNSSWAWGTPSNTIIDRAAEGNNAWATNLTGDYNNAELSYLVSPCFDLSSLTSPTISLALILDIEDADDGFMNGFYDFGRLQYSTNGSSWTTLGTNGTGHNWYNNYMGNHMWDDTKGYWHSATYDIPTTSSSVQFRFVMDSDAYTVQEGYAIDNILIDEKENIYSGANTAVTEMVSGTSWIHFESGGDRIVSINPNGNNLGSTTTDVYINTGTLRDNTLQYYLDRNWKIVPTTAPASDVSVRLYLLDSEVEDLRAAAGSCGTCSTITDAFIAGVTKYTGINENGTLADNGSTTYSFFTPSNVEFVPYADGYYVQFDTPGFSEFYINGGHTGMNLPLPVELIDFTLTKDNKDAILDWETATEINSDKFEIELAKGTDELINDDFQKIGEVQASGNSNEPIQYQWIDKELNKIGDRYYRLKIIDLDGSYEYSPVRQLHFENSVAINIYPNPSKGQFNLNINSNKSTNASLRISDQLGRTIFTEQIAINEGENLIDNLVAKAKLGNGMFHIEILIDDYKWIEKLMLLNK